MSYLKTNDIQWDITIEWKYFSNILRMHHKTFVGIYFIRFCRLNNPTNTKHVSHLYIYYDSNCTDINSNLKYIKMFQYVLFKLLKLQFVPSFLRGYFSIAMFVRWTSRTLSFSILTSSEKHYLKLLNPLRPSVILKERLTKISILKSEEIIKKFLWAPRLWVGTRQQPILGYISNIDGHKNLVLKGLS